MAPDRRPHRTDTRPASALLFPQLLARACDFPAYLRRVGTGAIARLELPHRFVQERLVDGARENVVGQFDFADLLIIQIHYIDCRHGSYLFDLRTTTYPPLGPGTAPFTTSTLSSVSTSITSRLRTVTRSWPMCPPMRMPGSTRDGKLDAPMDPGARWNIEPWVSSPPLKWWRFTTPAKPRPLLMPMTSTLSLGLNWSTS